MRIFNCPLRKRLVRFIVETENHFHRKIWLFPKVWERRSVVVEHHFVVCDNLTAYSCLLIFKKALCIFLVISLSISGW